MSAQIQFNLFEDPHITRAMEPGIEIVEQFVVKPKQWFDYLTSNICWKTEYKSRHYATFGVSYNTKTDTKRTSPLPQWLAPLCQNIHKNFGFQPNNCLINSYPDGNHYISYHSDQDTEMKAQTGVVIVSLGAVRQMSLRRIDNHKICFHYPLLSGSALYMQDALQTQWQHGVLKQAGNGHRISLSFRCLID